MKVPKQGETTITIESAFLRNADNLTPNNSTLCAGLLIVMLSEPLSLLTITKRDLNDLNGFVRFLAKRLPKECPTDRIIQISQIFLSPLRAEIIQIITNLTNIFECHTDRNHTNHYKMGSINSETCRVPPGRSSVTS